MNLGENVLRVGQEKINFPRLHQPTIDGGRNRNQQVQRRENLDVERTEEELVEELPVFMTTEVLIENLLCSSYYPTILGIEAHYFTATDGRRRYKYWMWKRPISLTPGYFTSTVRSDCYGTVRQLLC